MEREQDEKVRRIVEWRESIAALPNDYFFELLHVYLGEIETPFNKQKLVERLSAFLRKEENRRNIVAFLDSRDLKILSAIKFIHEVDLPKLEKFFVPGISMGDLYSAVASLEERLVIYSRKDEAACKNFIRINPMLEENILPLLKISDLVGEEHLEEKPSVYFSKIPGTMETAYFLWYLMKSGDICRGDGSFKKKPESDLRDVLGIEDTSPYRYILSALSSLLIVTEKESGKGGQVNMDRLMKFAALSQRSRLSYICAASAGILSRRSISSNASLFFDTLNFIRGGYYSRQKIYEIAFLIREKKGGDNVFRTSRFSRILSRSEGEEDSAIDSTVVGKMIDAALALGIMGADEEDGQVLCVNEKFFSDERLSADKKLLSVDSAYMVTVMPGLSLCDMIPLVEFLDPVSCDVTMTLEINRASVSRGLDFGMDEKSICGTLREYSSFSLPQNLEMSVSDWASAYGNAAIYKGYVVRLSETLALCAEKNPVFAKRIVEKIAPGIYLLDCADDSEASDLLKKLGIDTVPKIKTARREAALSSFSEISSSGNVLDVPESEGESSAPVQESGGTIIKEFLGMLSGMELTSDQREGLEDRIRRRIVVNAEQLRPESVRFELTRATGMDFTGKIHVIERAVAENCMLEAVLSSGEVLLGYPVSFQKNLGEHELRLNCGEKEVEVSVARISALKRIRNAVTLRKFSE